MPSAWTFGLKSKICLTRQLWEQKHDKKQADCDLLVFYRCFIQFICGYTLSPLNCVSYNWLYNPPVASNSA
jgi:hypothetical protein